MDNTDNKIVAALRQNGRASLSELSERLGLSRTTLRARMERMQRHGDIVGFTVLMKEDVVSAPVRGLMMVSISGPGTDRILRQVQGYGEVTGVHTTNGRWDAILEISTQNLEQFDVVLSGIRRINGVRESETSLLLTTMKSA